MRNRELRSRYRQAVFPDSLSAPLGSFVQAVDALRPVHSPELTYQLDFAERVLLREVLDPHEHASHWWQTGLHIIHLGIGEHPSLASEFGEALEELRAQLDARLGPYETVSLCEIDSTTVGGVCLLSELMTYPQTTFVAPNAYSLAEALFHDHAWYRAVYAGKAPVGFVMLEDNAEKKEYFLWRFMIAPPFQRMGFGAKAVKAVIEYVKTRPGATELGVSYIDHEEGPAGFYRRLGFRETGEVEEGEVIMRLDLQA